MYGKSVTLGRHLEDRAECNTGPGRRRITRGIPRAIMLAKESLLTLNMPIGLSQDEVGEIMAVLRK